jgi:hypothetical protein
MRPNTIWYLDRDYNSEDVSSGVPRAIVLIELAGGKVFTIFTTLKSDNSVYGLLLFIMTLKT